jgi:hypothetical protein
LLFQQTCPYILTIFTNILVTYAWNSLLEGNRANQRTESFPKMTNILQRGSLTEAHLVTVENREHWHSP